MALAVALMTAAFVLAKTGRDALFFMGSGLRDLPQAYIAIAILALPMAAAALALMRAIGPRRARVVAPLVMAFALVGFHLVATPGGGPLMTSIFVSVPLAFGVLFSMAWLLAGDVLEGAERQAAVRAYSEIGAASILGGIVGSLLARLLAGSALPNVLLLAGAIALAASAAVMLLAQRAFPLRTHAPGQVARPHLGFSAVGTALSQPYVLLLLAVAMAAALVGVLVEFQFYVAAGTSGRDARENASFFANAYLALNASAFLIQLWVLPALQRVLGLGGALLVLPGVLLGGGAALLANASIATRSLLRVAEGGLKSSVHRTTWEQAFLPLERGLRPVAKLVVDGAGARLAEGAAAVMLFAWLRWGIGDRRLVGADVGWVTWTLIGSVAVWIGATRFLGRRLAPIESGAEASVAIPLPDS